MSETQEVKKPNGAPPPELVPLAKPKPLIAKLAEIVSVIDHVEKSGRNTFQNYNYVKAADVAWIVRKALSDRKIYLVTDVVEIRNYEIPAREGVMQAVDVKVQFSFFDGESPETPPIVLHSYGTGTDKGDKAVYKAMTGALKYGLRHAFLIPDESDPEADTATDKATAQKELGKKKVEDLKGKLESAVGMAQNKKEGVPSLFYTFPAEFNGHFALVYGTEEMLKANKDPLLHNGTWSNKLNAFKVAEDKLEDLKYVFQELGVPFKLLQAGDSR